MRRLILLAVAVLLLSAGFSQATTLVKLDFSDLTQGSKQVVVGTVTGFEGHWDETRTFIFTDVTISVEHYLSGSGPAEIVVRTPGGQIGDQAMLAHGAPSFQLGELVLVFLTQWEDGTPKVHGYMQGKSTVTANADGKLTLDGGIAHGRTLKGVAFELRKDLNNWNGPVLPLQPDNE